MNQLGDLPERVDVLHGEIDVDDVHLELVLDEHGEVREVEGVDQAAADQRFVVAKRIRWVAQELGANEASQPVENLAYDPSSLARCARYLRRFAARDVLPLDVLITQPRATRCSSPRVAPI